MKENQNPFEIDFDSYIRQSEPEKQENGKLWQKRHSVLLLICCFLFISGSSPVCFIK
jgi:hypothetical protein